MHSPYTILVNKKPAALDPVRVSAYPFNRTWPGSQRDIAQSRLSYMLRIFDDTPVNIELTADVDFDRVTVRPLSRNVTAVSGDAPKRSLSLTLREHGSYVVELDDRRRVIYVFYESAQHADASGVSYYFAPGEHHVGLLTLHDGDSVYIDRDAVVYGSIFADSASDIRIFGQGILNGGWETRTELHGDIGWNDEENYAPDSVHTYGGIRLFRCRNVHIEGITVTDPASYAVSLYDSEAITIENVKVVGLWKYNTDGIDLINCRRAKIERCFIHSFDDCTCQKGFTAFSEHSVEDITVRGCVLWCDWGKVFDIGLACAAPEMKNITIEDCDVIYAMHSVITVSNGQWADVHNVTFRNIRVEYSPIPDVPLLQISDDQVYRNEHSDHQPTLISISDGRRNWQGHVSYDDARTKIRNVAIENIDVYLDERVQILPRIAVKKITPSSTFEHITVRNVSINGKFEPRLTYTYEN